MANITLHNDRDNSATYVSNVFIDHYMTSANGEYVKIYLYLLRCMNSPESSFSISKTADRFEHTEKDIQRALKYWEKMKLLRLEYDGDKGLSGIYFLDSSGESTVQKDIETAVHAVPEFPQKETPPDHKQNTAGSEAVSGFIASAHCEQTAPDADSAPVSKPAKEEETMESAVTEQKRSFTAAELSAFQEKENVRELLFVTEHYVRRPLTPTDINTILFWFDSLAFSTDLIEYLIEYCVGKGHTSLHYMDKVAMGWKDGCVSTVEQARRVSSAFSQIHFSVMRALGISGRNLVPAEVAYIDKWSRTYGFTQDIITEACRRTIASTHQPSFEYTDGILTNWSKKQVKNLNDVVKLDSAYQKSKTSAALQAKAASPNKFNNFSQRTYDYDKLEQQLLNH